MSTARKPPYQEIDHPADVGIRVHAGSLGELLENAARGMCELMLDTGTVRPARSRPVQAEGDDVEMLLVEWLQEILFAFDAERFAPAEVRVEEAEPWSARGTVRGEPFDPARHRGRNEIKAVTWHDLEVVRRNETYEVTIIFDV